MKPPHCWVDSHLIVWWTFLLQQKWNEEGLNSWDQNGEFSILFTKLKPEERQEECRALRASPNAFPNTGSVGLIHPQTVDFLLSPTRLLFPLKPRSQDSSPVLVQSLLIRRVTEAWRIPLAPKTLKFPLATVTLPRGLFNPTFSGSTVPASSQGLQTKLWLISR